MSFGGTAKSVATGAATGSILGPLGSIAGGVLGPIIGGLFGRSGQSAANAANLRIARENRAWQTAMSNTAYQRAARDLEAAGLNRILALGQPATTPAGNIATMQNENALLADGISKGVTAGLTARRMNAEINHVNARTELVGAQRRALGGASEIGAGLEEIFRLIKQKLSGEKTPLEFGGMGNQIVSDIGNTAKSVKDYLGKVADSVGLTPHKAERHLLAIVKQMDLPKMTDEEYLRWAAENPERIKQFLERNK